MQDGKALQGGTSHFLGQNFARSFDVMYQDKDGQQQYVWNTSWGLTTRMIGALVMVHSDDDGCRFPPRIAPKQIVIIPIKHKPEHVEAVDDYVQSIQKSLPSELPRLQEGQDQSAHIHHDC